VGVNGGAPNVEAHIEISELELRQITFDMLPERIMRFRAVPDRIESFGIPKSGRF